MKRNEVLERLIMGTQACTGHYVFGRSGGPYPKAVAQWTFPVADETRAALQKTTFYSEQYEA